MFFFAKGPKRIAKAVSKFQGILDELTVGGNETAEMIADSKRTIAVLQATNVELQLAAAQAAKTVEAVAKIAAEAK